MQRKTPNEDRHSPIRKCILSGEHGERAALIRLALGPDGSVAPDLFAKAPGRGAWIGVDHAELSKAQAKGKLAGLLRRAFKTDKIEIIDDLAGRIDRGLEKAFLDRLGLEARAGHLILGAEKIDTASRSGQVRLLLHASDASADGSGKRDQAWRVGEDAEGSGKGGIKLPVDRDSLSAALGRQNAVHVALIDQKAADRVMHHLGRWLNFKGCSKAPLDSASDASDARGRDTDISAID
ncbi:DUF448 domain-containing protein [Sphingorhabdus contaminans]|uniref:DUF448 domain-containing protein n=1 Tax=Sphingorhabdus contaminans TaxID=1343899 RepID=UPI003D2E2041